MDEMHLLQTFEAACVQAQNGQEQKKAEAILMEFRKIPNALIFHKHVMESAKSTISVFFAALGMKEIVLRDWESVKPDLKQTLRLFLLEFVVAKIYEPFVERQALQTLAIMSKRGWMEGDVNQQTQLRDSIFLALEPLFLSVPNDIASNKLELRNRKIAVSTFSILIDEFTMAKSSSLGLSWEYHKKCLGSFQKVELKKIFQLSVGLFKKLVPQNSALPEFTKLLESCLSLIVQILHWRFDETEPSEISFRSKADSSLIRLGLDWAELILKADLLEIFFKLYEVCNNQPNFMQSIVIGLTQLCSLDKSIFKGDDKAEATYLSKLLHGLIYFIKNSKAQNGIIEIIGISQMISRLVSNFRLASIVQTSDIISTFFQEFAGFTLRCLETLRKSQDMDLKTEIERSFDSLLEAWVVLLGEEVIKNTSLQSFFKEVAAKIFAEYVRTKMVVGAEELDETDLDDNQNDQIEQLNAASFLGRVDILSSTQLLVTLLKETASKWEMLVKSAKPTASIDDVDGLEVILEELYCLINISGHFLADSGVGEIPMVPEQMSAAILNCHQNQLSDPIVTFFNVMFQITQLENLLMSSHPGLISPRVTKSLMTFFSRSITTYLFPTILPVLEASGMYQMFGTKGGLSVVKFLTEKVGINFEKSFAEDEVLEASCQLLTGLVSKTRSIGVHLVEVDSWKVLIQTLTNTLKNKIQQISGNSQRNCMQVLLGMTDSVSNNEGIRKQYYLEVSGTTFASFLALLQNPTFSKVSASSMGQISSFLDRIRGVVRSSISDESWIFESIKPFFGLFPDLMTLYKDQPTIVISILKLYRDFAEFQVENLDESEMEIFFTSVVALFQKYSQFFVSKFKSFQSNKLQQVTEQELYSDLICMLKFLLISVTFMSNHSGGEKVIFFGISCILPLITQEMLQYPKLARHYYGLLHNVFTEYPIQTSALDPNFFKLLVESLKLGLGNSNEEISKKSLESLGFLMKFNCEHKLESQVFGLEKQISAYPSLLEDLLRFTMTNLLLVDFSSELLEAYAIMLLPLISCQMTSFSSMMTQLISTQIDTNVKNIFVNACQDLVSKNGVSFDYKFGRKNCEVFMKNLEEFLLRVKGFMLTK